MLGRMGGLLYEPIGGKFIVWLFYDGGSNAFYIDNNKHVLAIIAIIV